MKVWGKRGSLDEQFVPVYQTAARLGKFTRTQTAAVEPDGGKVAARSANAQTATADPRKAQLTDQPYPAAMETTARVRVDLYTDPTTGMGYNLVLPADGKLSPVNS